MNHQVNNQDWKDVVIRQKPAKTIPLKNPLSKPHANKNVQQTPSINARKIEKVLDDEENTSVIIQNVSYDLSIQIQQARQKKKWTRKDLANACSLTENTIRDYENGSCMPNQNEINKMSRVLGVQLKK